MLKELGAMSITVGLILFFGGFLSKDITGGIVGFTIGPVLISYGAQLIK